MEFKIKFKMELKNMEFVAQNMEKAFSQSKIHHETEFW